MEGKTWGNIHYYNLMSRNIENNSLLYRFYLQRKIGHFMVFKRRCEL